MGTADAGVKLALEVLDMMDQRARDIRRKLHASYGVRTPEQAETVAAAHQRVPLP